MQLSLPLPAHESLPTRLRVYRVQSIDIRNSSSFSILILTQLFINVRFIQLCIWSAKLLVNLKMQPSLNIEGNRGSRAVAEVVFKYVNPRKEQNVENSASQKAARSRDAHPLEYLTRYALYRKNDVIIRHFQTTKMYLLSPQCEGGRDNRFKRES